MIDIIKFAYIKTQKIYTLKHLKKQNKQKCQQIFLKD